MNYNEGMKYYILRIWGGVDPEPLIGPFKTYTAMLDRARKIHANQREKDAIFWIGVTPERERPFVDSFLGEEMRVF
jgi:hypothetical protein